MQQIGTVQILDGFGNLVHDILLMLILEDVFADDAVQVDVHELEHEIYVFVIVSFDDVYELDDVVVVELLQEYDLAVGALRIRRMLKRIEDLLEGVYLVGAPIEHLPDVAVGATADLSLDFIAAQNVGFDVLCHGWVITFDNIFIVDAASQPAVAQL